MCFFKGNAELKRLKREFEERTSFRKDKRYRSSFYIETKYGNVSIDFRGVMISIYYSFKDDIELPEKQFEQICDLCVKKQAEIHKHLEWGSLDFDFIEFVFSRKKYKELSGNDLIIACQNVQNFVEENVAHCLEKINEDY